MEKALRFSSEAILKAFQFGLIVDVASINKFKQIEDKKLKKLKLNVKSFDKNLNWPKIDQYFC